MEATTELEKGPFGSSSHLTVKGYINATEILRGTVKKHSILKDIIQIEVDLPPFHPIFDKFIFDKVLIMLTSLPPLEFLTKIMKF